MDFIFTRTGSTACKIIRAIDGGDWSHCGVLVAQSERIIEATYEGGGVCNRTFRSLLVDSKPEGFLKMLSVKLPFERAAEEFAVKAVGAPYDWPALPSLAIRKVFGTAPLWARPEAWYCAELVLATCAAGGRPIGGPLRRYGVEAAFRHILNLSTVQESAA